MAETLHDAVAQEQEQKKHERRLQKLLKCNGLTSLDVPQDGNCLFSTIALQINESVESCQTIFDPSVVREAVFYEITEHIDEYKPLN